MWGQLAAAGGQAILGAIGSHAAAQQQEAAANEAARMAQRGYYGNVALNEPWRQAGNNALSTIGGMYGWTPAPYASAQDLAATNTPLNAKQVKNLIKRGLTYEQIQAQGRITGNLNPKAIKRLTRAGLSPEQIQGLSASNIAQSAPVAQPAPGAAVAGAPGALPPGTPEGTDPRFAAFFNSPDFQLRRQAAEEAIQRTAAARSGPSNPATMLAVGNRVGAMQGEEYNNWYNRLFQIAQGGQQAAGAVQNAQGNYTGQATNAVGAAGDARASGVLGITNSASNAIGAGMDYYAMQDYLKKMPQQSGPVWRPTAGAYPGTYQAGAAALPGGGSINPNLPWLSY